MRKMIACSVITLALLTGCTSAPTESNPPAPVAAKGPFKVGDRVQVGNQALTVFGGRILSPNRVTLYTSRPAHEGHAWLELDCMIENVGSEPIKVRSLTALELHDGWSLYRDVLLAGMPEDPLTGDVAAGANIRNTVVFEVPVASKNWNLEFRDRDLGDPAIINLGNIVATAPKE